MKPRVKIYFLACALACVLAPSAVAQEGHPLVGIWSGDWGPTPSERYPVLIDLSWETTTLAGIINPGYPDAAPIRVGMLDSSNWTVHLEADAMDEDGNPLSIIVDGTLEDIGSPNRTLSGTWIRGGSEGDFKLTRE
jgi:hypothetical protein